MAITRIIKNEEEYQQRYAKYPFLLQEAVEEEYADLLVCDCDEDSVLFEDLEPRVNIATEGYFYLCPVCEQRWVFIISSRELIKAS